MEKNAKIVLLFDKEQKRMQRSEHYFIKNGKERKDRNVLLKIMDAQPCPLTSALQRVELLEGCSLNSIPLFFLQRGWWMKSTRRRLGKVKSSLCFKSLLL